MIEEAKARLKELRRQAGVLRGEIEELRNYLRECEEDPDAPEVDLKPRNKEIYRRWWFGESPRVLAAEYGLKPGTITQICQLISKILQSKNWARYPDHKELATAGFDRPRPQEPIGAASPNKHGRFNKRPSGV